MIDDLLIPLNGPPLDRDIIFPPRIHDPKWGVASRDLVHLGKPRSLLRGQMNVPFVLGEQDAQPELGVQKIDESLTAVSGKLVAPV